MVYNWLGLMAFLIFALVYGVIALTSPITIMRLAMIWPRFIFPKLLREENIRPKVREAMRMIDQAPDQYSKQFWYQLLAVRISGAIALIAFLLGIFGVWAVTVLNPSVR